MASSEESAYDPKVARASHGAIDDALRNHAAAMKIEGTITAWTLIASTLRVDANDEYESLFVATSQGISQFTQIGILSTALEHAKGDTFIELDSGE
jgi:hypothetical protein